MLGFHLYSDQLNFSPTSILLLGYKNALLISKKQNNGFN